MTDSGDVKLCRFRPVQVRGVHFAGLQGKGLGRRICDDPPTIQLTFEHKVGDQDAGQEAFYTASRDNCCVVCGSHKHLLRYRVRLFDFIDTCLNSQKGIGEHLESPDPVTESNDVCSCLVLTKTCQSTHEEGYARLVTLISGENNSLDLPWKACNQEVSNLVLSMGNTLSAIWILWSAGGAGLLQEVLPCAAEESQKPRCGAALF